MEVERMNPDLSFANQPNVQTTQPVGIVDLAETNWDKPFENIVIDQHTVNYFKKLIRKYKKQMGDNETGSVCSGGLQQYLNKQQCKQNNDRSDGQNGSHFENLPVDVRLHIFSYLPAKDLCRLSRVCRGWYDVMEDNLLWQGLLQRDIKHWCVISHSTNPAIYKEVQSEWSYKDIYLRCSPEVNQLLHQQNAIFNNITSMIRYFFPKKTPTFAMFGPGLESSTSSLVRLMMSNNEVFKTMGLFPGQFDGGVGGGMTMKTSTNQLFHLSVLYSASKEERQNVNRDRMQQNRLLQESRNTDGADKYELMSSVRDLCQMLDGFVYVVDASKDAPSVESGLDELTAMVSERWSATHVPVLVLSCVSGPDTPRLACCDVVEKLQLTQLDKPWQVRNCVINNTLDGVTEGFVWLSEQTQRK